MHSSVLSMHGMAEKQLCRTQIADLVIDMGGSVIVSVGGPSRRTDMLDCVMPM